MGRKKGHHSGPPPLKTPPQANKNVQQTVKDMVGPIKPDIAPILAIQKQQLIADPNKQHAGNLIQAAQIAEVSSK
ncbi:Hypothetical predicted protein, partial [Olea europaea subsp. europaea]